jgi:hypothetical protein
VDSHLIDDAVAHFGARGWVVLDVLPRSTRALLATWADDVAALPDDTGVLRHYEQTDAGSQLCRAECFFWLHGGLRDLLAHGELPFVASALLGEPVFLYKEKINYKLPGGAGYSPHQDAPAYPLVSTHVSAMVAIDPADDANGGLQVVSGCFDEVLPVDERGCIRPDVVETLEWESVSVPAGMTLWFHSRTPHRSGPNLSAEPRRALYPTYNAAHDGDRRVEYYRAKTSHLRSADDGDRARVSLIADFEGRPV